MYERRTYGFRQPGDLLAVDVGLVPGQDVDQAGAGGEPLLEKTALHFGRHVHLGQAGGDDGGRQDYPQEGLVARRSGAEVAELHKAARDRDLFLDGLCGIEPMVKSRCGAWQTQPGPLLAARPARAPEIPEETFDSTCGVLIRVGP